MTETHTTTLAVGFPALLAAVPGLLDKLAELRDPDVAGPDLGERIYPMVAPAGAAEPLIVHQQVSGTGESGHLSGRGHLASAVRQVVVWGKTPDDVAAICRLLLWLDDGARARGTYAGLVVSTTQIVNELERYAPATDPDELDSFGLQYDVRVWYRR